MSFTQSFPYLLLCDSSEQTKDILHKRTSDGEYIKGQIHHQNDLALI